MNFKQLYKDIIKNKYYVFSFEDLLTLYYNENKQNLKQMLYRWKQKNWIRSLKKGLYELTYPDEYIIPDMYIANKLYSPSYVSLETALSNYSIIPEVSMAVTSITTKPTRQFKNVHGLFIYHTLRPEFFTGYYIEKQGKFEIFIAEPEKALIDFIYFKTYRNKKFNLQEERLDFDIISSFNKKKLKKYIKQYNLKLEELNAYL